MHQGNIFNNRKSLVTPISLSYTIYNLMEKRDLLSILQVYVFRQQKSRLWDCNISKHPLRNMKRWMIFSVRHGDKCNEKVLHHYCNCSFHFFIYYYIYTISFFHPPCYYYLYAKNMFVSLHNKQLAEIYDFSWKHLTFCIRISTHTHTHTYWGKVVIFYTYWRSWRQFIYLYYLCVCTKTWLNKKNNMNKIKAIITMNTKFFFFHEKKRTK